MLSACAHFSAVMFTGHLWDNHLGAFVPAQPGHPGTPLQGERSAEENDDGHGAPSPLLQHLRHPKSQPTVGTAFSLSHLCERDVVKKEKKRKGSDYAISVWSCELGGWFICIQYLLYFKLNCTLVLLLFFSLHVVKYIIFPLISQPQVENGSIKSSG